MVKTNARRTKRHPSNEAPIQPVGDPVTVRGKLALLGWPSVNAWSTAHGYTRLMAGYCIRTWGNRTDRRPHGGIARAVMADLRATFAEGRRPEHVQPAGD